MCEALRELMKDEIEKDVNDAYAKGESKGEANIIRKMHNNGISPEQISASTGMDLEQINAILAGKELAQY